MKKKSGTLKDELIYYEGTKKTKLIAVTNYKTLDTNFSYSLLELNPETGRKHQLRKQLLIHGNPIYGDVKYNLPSKRISKKSNLMLHAYKIHFSINGVKYNFSAKPSDAFSKFINEKYLKTSL